MWHGWSIRNAKSQIVYFLKFYGDYCKNYSPSLCLWYLAGNGVVPRSS